MEPVCISGHVTGGVVSASSVSGLGLMLDCSSIDSGFDSGGIPGVSLGGAAPRVLSVGLTFAGAVKVGEMQDMLVGVETLLSKVTVSVGMELMSGTAVSVGGVGS